MMRPMRIGCWAAAGSSMSNPASATSKLRIGSSPSVHACLHRILDVLDLVELHVAQLIADLLDAPDIDRLDDVAGLRVDRDRAARALPGHALGGRDQAFAVGLEAGFLQRLIDEVRAVIAADG